MNTEPSTVATVEHGGFTVSSNTSTAEEMTGILEARDSQKTGGDVQETHTDENGEPDLSHAASELGKKGAEAAAAKRAAEAKEAAKAEKADKDTEKAPSEAEDKRKGNPRHDPQARVAQATREAAEARREAAAAREEAARIRAELEHARSARQIEEPPKPPKAQPEGKPRVEDFESYNDFMEASIEWRLQEERNKAAQHEQTRERLKAQDEFEGKFAASIRKAAEEDPDFHSKVNPEIPKLQPVHMMDDPRRATGRNWLASEIIASEKDAPALMLYLTEHNDDFQRIAALSTPHAVTREIAKLVTRLEVETTATNSKPSVSKAHPPVRPVTGAPQVVDEGTFREGMSLDEYAKRWKPAKSR